MTCLWGKRVKGDLIFLQRTMVLAESAKSASMRRLGCKMKENESLRIGKELFSFAYKEFCVRFRSYAAPGCLLEAFDQFVLLTNYAQPRGSCTCCTLYVAVRASRASSAQLTYCVLAHACLSRLASQRQAASARTASATSNSQ